MTAVQNGDGAPSAQDLETSTRNQGVVPEGAPAANPPRSTSSSKDALHAQDAASNDRNRWQSEDAAANGKAGGYHTEAEKTV